jgi:hypothetical protein
MESEQIEKIMYALTVNRKPSARVLWLARGAINKLFKFQRFSLLDYWEKRIREEPKTAQLAQETYEEYLEGLNSESQEDQPPSEPAYVAKRGDICAACQWREEGGVNGAGVCAQCGCNIWTKIRIPKSTCPVQKW